MRRKVGFFGAVHARGERLAARFVFMPVGGMTERNTGMIRNRLTPWLVLPAIALGSLTLAACGSDDTQTVTKRTVIEEQPQTVRTETTTTTVQED